MSFCLCCHSVGWQFSWIPLISSNVALTSDLKCIVEKSILICVSQQLTHFICYVYMNVWVWILSLSNSLTILHLFSLFKLETPTSSNVFFIHQYIFLAYYPFKVSQISFWHILNAGFFFLFSSCRCFKFPFGMLSPFNFLAIFKVVFS